MDDLAGGNFVDQIVRKDPDDSLLIHSALLYRWISVDAASSDVQKQIYGHNEECQNYKETLPTLAARICVTLDSQTLLDVLVVRRIIVPWLIRKPFILCIAS